MWHLTNEAWTDTRVEVCHCSECVRRFPEGSGLVDLVLYSNSVNELEKDSKCSGEMRQRVEGQGCRAVSFE